MRITPPVTWLQVGYSELVAIARNAQRVQRRTFHCWRQRAQEVQSQHLETGRVFASWRRAARAASGARGLRPNRLLQRLDCVDARHLILEAWKTLMRL